MATHLRTELIVDALQMALWRRNPDVGLIHHMDRGVLFAALSFGKRLEEAGIVASMSRVGSALDNVFLESFVASWGVKYSYSTRGIGLLAVGLPGQPYSIL
jgi:putative transposase